MHIHPYHLPTPWPSSVSWNITLFERPPLIVFHLFIFPYETIGLSFTTNIFRFFIVVDIVILWNNFLTNMVSSQNLFQHHEFIAFLVRRASEYAPILVLHSLWLLCKMPTDDSLATRCQNDIGTPNQYLDLCYCFTTHKWESIRVRFLVTPGELSRLKEQHKDKTDVVHSVMSKGLLVRARMGTHDWEHCTGVLLAKRAMSIQNI